MNKAQIIESIAKGLGLSKAATKRNINAFLEEVQKCVRKDKVVSLVGFGTFKVRSRTARMGRNPKTGASIRIKASKTVAFKPGKPFRNSI